MQPKYIYEYFERKCLRKANLTEEKANHVVDMAASEGLTLYYYKCDLCSSYHLTKTCPTDYLKHKQENYETITNGYEAKKQA
jgi:hypothetical protein